MIRYSIPSNKLFQFFFISLKREALICGNFFDHMLRCFGFVFPSILDSSLLRPNQNFVLLDRSIGFDRSPSRFDVPLDGFR
jgi:hypothetical protein